MNGRTDFSSRVMRKQPLYRPNKDHDAKYCITFEKKIFWRHLKCHFRDWRACSSRMQISLFADGDFADAFGTSKERSTFASAFNDGSTCNIYVTCLMLFLSQSQTSIKALWNGNLAVPFTKVIIICQTICMDGVVQDGHLNHTRLKRECYHYKIWCSSNYVYQGLLQAD